MTIKWPPHGNVDVSTIHVPDLWHIAQAEQRPADRESILECWSLAHAMLSKLRHIADAQNDDQKPHTDG